MENFNLNNVSYEEMFEGMKVGLARALSEYEGTAIKPDDLMLRPDCCMTRSAYGEDKMLYPKIKLDISVKKVNTWMIIFNPFTIYLAEYDASENIYESKSLTNTLVDFMVRRFPNSSYLERRDKYFKDAEINKNLYDYLITVY